LFYLLSLLNGVLITIMIVFNGGLTEVYGIYSATVIIHIAGLTVIAALVLIRRENPFARIYPWFLYLGGGVGVMTTVFNNLSFGRISVSAILALSLLGQSVAGLIVDQYGLLGMTRHPFQRRKLVGLSVVLTGIVFMITQLEVVAVILSFLAGFCIVAARTLTAKLAERTSVRTGTLYNYMIGLSVSLLALLLLGRGEVVWSEFAFSPNWYIYLGGVVGVCVVLLSNVTVLRVSAFYLNLLTFVGQIFSGVLLDAVLSGAFSSRILIGGVLVSIGLCVDLVMDKKRYAPVTVDAE